MTDDNDGLDEFNDAAKKQESSEQNSKTENSNSTDRGPIDPRLQEKMENGEISPGKYVQYSAYGPGFMPTTRTVPRLAQGIYSLMMTPAGGVFIPHKIYTDKLLRLPDSKSDEVISEIEKFWTLKPAFQKFGFTHKRGLLLWGPPGSGKTSTITFVMKQMVESGGLVVIANVHPTTTSDMLSKLRDIEPDRPMVVVLEDIDTIIESYGESEVLSLLDGENSIDNVVFLATTNYPEDLDARVVNRPSRFDRVVKIDVPNDEARRLYLISRNIGKDGEDLDKWVEKTKGFSIAHLKELIVSVKCYGVGFEATIKRLKKMMSDSPSSEEDGSKTGFRTGE